MGRTKKTPEKKFTHERTKQDKCYEAIMLMEDKGEEDHIFICHRRGNFKKGAGYSFEEAAFETGLEAEEAYSLFIYMNAQALKNEISRRRCHTPEYQEEQRLIHLKEMEDARKDDDPNGKMWY